MKHKGQFANKVYPENSVFEFTYIEFYISVKLLHSFHFVYSEGTLLLKARTDWRLEQCDNGNM